MAKTQIALKAYSSAIDTIQNALDHLEAQTDSDDETKKNRKPFQDLLKEAKELESQQAADRGVAQEEETSIKLVNRKISIREFEKGREIGFGNFSEIVVVKHRTTGETFALKIIDKKRAEDLAKRQHPNVYNEIQMERRTLLERLPPHPFIVRMFHAFQDYNSLYFLMELHEECGDLWSTIRYKTRMVGCHRSLAKVWLAELVDAIEHMHTHGIVHRDLKAENVLLSSTRHVIVVDFGTAKDLIQTDLNGPEFVGTPDFMSPEAAHGTSGADEIRKASEKGDVGADHSADLWALGAIAFILHTGQTPFSCPSPYLTFLKIRRANLYRPWGIADDDAWDLIHSLMQLEPHKRLGADAFELRVHPHSRIMKKHEGGYDIIRQHSYFTGGSEDGQTTVDKESSPVPSLRDLCIRACAELAYQDSLDLDICDQHPPGDQSSHDMTRLGPRDRKCVMHLLDRLRLLSEPQLYRRFFVDQVSYRLDKIREGARDYVGLTQMTDDQGKPPSAVNNNDPYATPEKVEPLKIAYVNMSLTSDLTDEVRKQRLKVLKKCIATINRSRPKLVVATGSIDESGKKTLAKVSESIPVIMGDGSTFFTFWHSGVQGVVLREKDFSAASGADVKGDQFRWLREQMEQCRLMKQRLFVFVGSDARDLPKFLLKRLSRGKVACLFGPSKDDMCFQDVVSYQANENNDDASVRSTDSDEDDADNHTMELVGCKVNGIQWITVEDGGDWEKEFTTMAE